MNRDDVILKKGFNLFEIKRLIFEFGYLMVGTECQVKNYICFSPIACPPICTSTLLL